MPVDAECKAFARVAKRTRCSTIERQMQPSRIEMYEFHSKIHLRCGIPGPLSRADRKLAARRAWTLAGSLTACQTRSPRGADMGEAGPISAVLTPREKMGTGGHVRQLVPRAPSLGRDSRLPNEAM